MDETPCYVDMVGTSTLHFKGEKNVDGQTTGHDKTRFTVVITIDANGRVLKSLVILKGLKKVPKVQVPDNIEVVVSDGGSMNEDIMKVWISKIFTSRGPYLATQKGVLFMDSHRYVLKLT